ncbi:hypothetical protein HGA34_01020 [Candidatus Falkowbacteria bacterium]|nr:hypothetical protein [Candidatus Falkowbacteria bacterium]
MKVILLRDIKNVGRKNEVKEVAQGYAVNYLVPAGLADLYNTAKRNEVETKQKAQAASKKPAAPKKAGRKDKKKKK